MKKLLALLLSTSMIFSLAACSPANEPSDENPGTTSAQDKAPDTKPASDAPREAELNIMMSFPQYMEQWETYCDQFEVKMLEEQNIDVTVNLEMPSSDQYESILQTRLSGGNAPDLYTIHCNNLGTYNAAGNLYDLSSQPLADLIYGDVKGTVTIDDQLLAVPIESQAWGVLYNKAMFAKYGLTPPDTLSGMEDVCATLVENGETPFMLAYQEQWVPQLMTALTLGGITAGQETDWLARMYADEGSYEEVSEIFNVIDLIMGNGTSRAMEQGSETGAAEFANGASAMFLQGTWAANTIMTANPDMELGVLPLPINENPECTRVNLSTSTTLGVYPDSAELDLALAFANYVLDEEDSSALFQSCTFNPLANCHDYEASSWVAEASSYVADGRSYQDLVIPSAVTDEQGRLLQEYYVGTVTVDEIITRLDKVFQDANALN